MTGSLPVSKGRSANAMVQAAEWIGHFHARGEQLLGRRAIPGLQQYDRAYYLGWSRRAEQATVEAGVAAEWFQAAVAGFRQSVGALLCTDASASLDWCLSEEAREAARACCARAVQTLGRPRDEFLGFLSSRSAGTG
jgi:hypothetical protein